MMILIRVIILKIKQFVKLHYLYPKQGKYKKIKTILSSDTVVGNDVVVEENVSINSHYLKQISDGVYIGKGTSINACSFIGKYVSISFDVKIGLMSHPLNYISTSPIFYSKRRNWVDENTYNEAINGLTEIGNDVLISANVSILAGVKIGDGAVIGAGAFVNKDIPPYAIAVGSPAKVISYRFSKEIIKQLQETKWWDLPKQELLKHKLYFNNPEEFLKQIKNK